MRQIQSRLSGEAVTVAKFKAICVTDGRGVRVEACLDEEACRYWRKWGYFRDKKYLDVLEAAYQASTGSIIIDGGTGWEKALETLYRYSEDLALFIVYHDLRQRGRRVLRGARKGTLIVRTGGRDLEVLVLEEGTTVKLEWLAEWSRIASGDGFNPIVAIVDRNGDVTYYEIRASLEIR